MQYFSRYHVQSHCGLQSKFLQGTIERRCQVRMIGKYDLRKTNITSRTIKSNFHDILMDTELNSKSTLIRNLHDNFSFAAMKIEVHATEMAKSAMGIVNEKCILGNASELQKK